jgi:uncharacterized protein (DUF58 family)
VTDAAAVVDLDPRVRIIGSLLGQSRSRRRGQSHDVVGSRAYVPGDDVRRIDWSASARLTSIAGEERFVVREFYAEESPIVVLAVDPAPTMCLYPPELPWLHKPEAVARCLAAIAGSAARHRCLVTVAGGTSDEISAPRQVEPDTLIGVGVRRVGDRVGTGRDWLSPLLGAGHRWLPPGTLVFALSDFLLGPDEMLVRQALDFEWELVPVVVSDERWERSFPAEVGGMTLPLADEEGRLRPCRVSSREARRRRAENESGWHSTLECFREAGFPPVVVSESGDDGIEEGFAGWNLEREGVLAA